MNRIGISSRLLFLLPALLLIPACNVFEEKDASKPADKPETTPSKNFVSGKVLLDDKPVAGEVVFIGADNKEQPPAPTNAEGRYFLVAPPAGKYKVVVRAMTLPTKKAPKLPDLPKAPKPGVAPPAKFAKPATSGLMIEVTGGPQTYDIVLKP